MYSSITWAGSGIDGVGEAVEPRTGVRPIGEPHVLCQAIPVTYLLPRILVRLRVRGAARHRVAVEVLELRRQLADDAGLALGGESGEREARGDERGPVTHRSLR